MRVLRAAKRSEHSSESGSCLLRPKTLMPRTTKFATFPDLLVLHMKKFQLVNWMPTKLGKRRIDAPISATDHQTFLLKCPTG